MSFIFDTLSEALSINIPSIIFRRPGGMPCQASDYPDPVVIHTHKDFSTSLSLGGSGVTPIILTLVT